MPEAHEAGAASRALIQVRQLAKAYPVRGGFFRRPTAWVRAVDDVSFEIAEGETLGLVGESGCGKTTVGYALLRLIEPTAGSVIFDGRDIFQLRPGEMKALRREMQIIFEDPYSVLDPRMTVGESIAQGLRIHKLGTPAEQRDKMMQILGRVGLDKHHAERQPGELSGGQRQRVGIARVLALQPRFIVADEPVSALDASIQSHILNLLDDLQDEFELTYLFIAHNLRVVEHIADRVAVMYLGKIVELAARAALFSSPLHPYTQALLSSIPSLRRAERKKRIQLRGEIPSPVNLPSGCRFHPRCPIAVERCAIEEPVFEETSPGHRVACWLAT